MPRRTVGVISATALLALGTACGSTVEQRSASHVGDRLNGFPTAAPDSAPASPAAGGQGPAGPHDLASPISAASAGSNAPKGVPSAGGVTSDTTSITRPITVGFLTVDYGAAASSVGHSGASATNPQQFFKSLVAFYNARGGLAGRKIQPIYETINGSSDNYDAASQSACTSFVEDHHVEVVLSSLWVNSVMASCLRKAGVAQIEGTIMTLNTTSTLRAIPDFFVPSGLPSDREGTMLIEGSIKQGWLTAKDKLGIVYDGCTYDVQAVNQTILPLLKQRGIPNVAVQASSCGQGFGDTAGFVSGTSNAVLKMRSEGVTKIMFVTTAAAGSVVFFSQAAESQGFHPSYLLTSTGGAGTLTSQGTLPAKQAEKILGFGWSSIYDLTTPPATAATNTCLKNFVSGGGTKPSNVNNTITLYSVCNDFTLLVNALTATRGDASTTLLQPAIEGLGTTARSLLNEGGAMALGAGKHYGVNAVRPFSYVASCACIQYIGSLRSIGSP